MSLSPAPYGSNPWQQAHWDARAAANFVWGGMGGGLVVASALSGAGGTALAAPMLVGVALIALGLASVFAEIGRPLRAANVVLNPRTSWMSREALVAPLLIACALATAAGYASLAYAAAVLALLFVYCQGRMVQAGRGIPAWRAPLVPSLFVTTGLAEGTGVWLAIAAWSGGSAPWLIVLLGVLVVLRLALFRTYRRGLGTTLAPAAAAALDAAGRRLAWGGTYLPVALVAAWAAGVPGGAWLAAAAGLLAAAFGAWFKATLVLRAGHNQGFALPHMPVRGVAS